MAIDPKVIYKQKIYVEQRTIKQDVKKNPKSTHDSEQPQTIRRLSQPSSRGNECLWNLGIQLENASDNERGLDSVHERV